MAQCFVCTYIFIERKVTTTKQKYKKEEEERTGESNSYIKQANMSMHIEYERVEILVGFAWSVFPI